MKLTRPNPKEERRVSNVFDPASLNIVDEQNDMMFIPENCWATITIAPPRLALRILGIVNISLARWASVVPLNASSSSMNWQYAQYYCFCQHLRATELVRGLTRSRAAITSEFRRRQNDRNESLQRCFLRSQRGDSIQRQSQNKIISRQTYQGKTI